MSETKVLRSVFLPISLDDSLKRIAYNEGKSKSEVIREYIKNGLAQASPSERLKEVKP